MSSEESVEKECEWKSNKGKSTREDAWLES